jgi:predicted NAD/FAD-dependent oxidoreductase
MAAAAPRVAVVGGGLSGSLAALGLRARGLAPVVYDAGAGDRLRAAPFFRAEHDRFSSLLRALEQRGAAAPWAGEFGILGSRGGGYLSKAHVPRKRPAAGGAPAPPPLRDSGDFCGFVDDGGAGALWAATGDVCASLRAMGGGDAPTRARVSELRWLGGSWRATADGGEADYDAVVVAGPPAVAAAALGTVAMDGDHAARLRELGDALAAVPAAPLASLSATVAGVDAPFDAATVPGSDVVQFVARERSRRPDAPAGSWSAVSTSAFAARGGADEELADELLRLLAPFGATAVEGPRCDRWDAGLADGSLEAWSRGEEDAIFLEPFAFAIAGDFVRRRSCPVESAALSGLEAGQRLGEFLLAQAELKN